MSFYWVKPKEAGVNHELIWGGIGLLMMAGGWVWPMIPSSLTPVQACPLKRMVALPCLSCGLTRSVVAFSHGDIIEAFLINPLGGLGVLLLSLFTLYSIVALLFRTRRLRFKFQNRFLKIAVHVGIVVAILINWVYLIIGRV